MSLHTVQDFMQRDVLVVNPETSLVDVHRLFVEEEINGAPVVDEANGVVVGVISSLDLLRAVRDEYDHVAPIAGTYFRDEFPGSELNWNDAPADLADRMASLKTSDAMVRECVSVTPHTPIAEVADIMRSQRIHRVLVIDDHTLVGILTTFDLLQILAEPHHAPTPTSPRRAPGDPVC